jgi:hypothetical protein
MYNFVFWYFYKFFEWRKDFKSVFLASAIVGLAIIIHVMLIYNLIKYFTGFSFGIMNGSYTDRKLIFLPFVLAVFLITYYSYYKTQSGYILEKNKLGKISSPLNIFYILLILVVPLLVAIKFNSLIIK